MKKIMLCLLGLLITFCCNKKSEKSCTVRLKVSSAQNCMVYLSRLPYFDEKNVIVDSALVKNGNDEIIFTIPLNEERQYEIEVKKSFKKFSFIADAPVIGIKANNITGKYTVSGSPATSSLINFNTMQSNEYQRLSKIFQTRDSFLQAKANKTKTDSIQKIIEKLSSTIASNYIYYADTVHNPAAFLQVFKNVDFGKNYNGLKAFIAKVSRRFSQYSSIDTLISQTLNMIDIFEKEYNIGDTIPAIQLPDKSGILFYTSSLKGKYYFIDFWATWCNNCLKYNFYKKQAAEILPSSKFQMVSVALDDNNIDWQKLIEKQELNWVQLIDEKIWQGPAAQTLKFDSIPFNFLVNPNGIIIDKAIKPDSLLSTLQRLIK